jgi:hypothetical protein
MPTVEEANAWNTWLQENSASLIGGDVQESIKGQTRRGRIKQISVNGDFLIFTTEWMAVDMGNGWRLSASRRSDANQFRFDIRGTRTNNLVRTGVYQLTSTMVTLTIFTKESGEMIPMPDITVT